MVKLVVFSKGVIDLDLGVTKFLMVCILLYVVTVIT